MLDDSPITTFGSDKARALLIYLASEADHPHRREQLTGLLWPDCPEVTARHNLRQTLFNIRQAIGDRTAEPPFLIITRSEVQFNAASSHALDVAAFNAHLAACNAHQHPQTTTCGECASHLQQAADLYRGKFLEQFFLDDNAEFEEWALIQREVLHRSVLEALSHLVGYYEACADLAQARRCASRQLELDPWREEAHRQMMRLLALSGERSAALRQYETCLRVLADELGVEPSAETRELQLQITRGDLGKRDEISVSLSTPSPPLPVPLTPFIGRERELAELERLIGNPQCRVITLVGIGGIGKTRLALQAADRNRDAFAQGAVFVPLASVDSNELIVPAIAEALGLVLPGSRDPRDIVLGYLGDKQILVVLDNLEHLPDCIGLFIEILQHAPGVKLLCTSRESLHLQSEWVYDVEGLPVPDDERTDEFDQYGAVALFVQHAQRSRVGYTLTAEERPGVARICRLVGGMPLALELAASWSRILTAREIADHIERDMHFLSTCMRDLPARHCCIQAVFDETWGMLTAEEQRVLSTLSVFRGGLARPAAEQVAGASLSVLASLVSKSLVRRIGWDRYDLHELVRQYASARLVADPGEKVAARERHGEYYLTLVKDQESRLCSQDQKHALGELATEIANIRLALEWAIDMHQTARLREVSFPLLYLYEIRGWHHEGESLFRDAAAKLEQFEEADPPLETRRQIAVLDMQTNQAYFSARVGKYAEAYAIHRRCAERLRALGDQTVLRYSLRYCGLAAQVLGKFDETELCLNESLELSRAADNPWDIGIDNAYLGYLTRMRGPLDRAGPYLRQAVEISRKLGDPRLLAVSLNGLGFVNLSLGQPVPARELAEEALSLAQETDDRYDLAISMVVLGEAAGLLGEPAKAQLLFEKSIALFKEIGDMPNLIGTNIRLGHVALSMGDAREAESHFRMAANIASRFESDVLTINALGGLASVRARTGAAEPAMELVVFVLRHPSSPLAARDLAKQLRPELEAQLTPAQIEALEDRTRAETLEGIAQRILGGSIH